MTAEFYVRETHREVAAGALWNGPHGACAKCMVSYPCYIIRALDEVSDTAEREAEQRIAALETALTKLNEIRDEAVRTQRATWSNLVYPLVAILNEAGFVSTVTDEELDRLFPSKSVSAATQEAGAGEPKQQAVSHPWSPREFSELWTPYEGRPKVFVRIECEFCRLPEDRHPTPAPPAPRPGEQEDGAGEHGEPRCDWCHQPIKLEESGASFGGITCHSQCWPLRRQHALLSPPAVQPGDQEADHASP